MSVEAQPALWIGIDAGEQHHALALLDEKGERLNKATCRNRIGAIGELLSRWMQKYSQTQLRIVTESTRGCGAMLSLVAPRLGLEIWEVAPQALAAFRESEGQPRKSDPWDAYLLARMGFLGVASCRPRTQPSVEEARLCRLARLWEQLGEWETRLWQTLRSRLLELAPTLVDRSSASPKYRSRRMLEVLSKFRGFEGVEAAPQQQIETLLNSVPQAQRTREAQALQDTFRALPMPEKLRSVLGLELDIIVGQLQELLQRKKEVKKQLEAAVHAHRLGQRLLDVPGVGRFTAAVLLGEVLPRARHATEPQIATYCGLTPLCRSSGQGPKRKRLTRGTNKHVLRSMYLCATAARRVSALDQAYYTKQIQRHQGHPTPHIVATLALARQRMKMLYRLMTSEVEYDKEILIRRHLQRLDKAA